MEGFEEFLDSALMRMEENEFQAYMRENQENRSYFIGPSGVDSCYKQQAYKYHEVEPPVHRSTDAADLGTLMHLGWSALIKAQFDPKDRSADVAIEVEGMPRGGSADDVDWVNRIVTDVKTAKDVIWQGFVNRGTPYQSYWDQVEVYALGLRQMYGGDWTLRIKAFNRETGAHMDFERAADPERGMALVEKTAQRHASLLASAAFIGTVDNPLALVDTFPREGKGPGRGMPCDYCEFLSLCWPTTGPDDPRTPQSTTVEGDAEALGALAMEYLEAAAEESKGKQRKYDSQAFLKGMDGEYPGPDGNTYKVTTVGGRSKEVPDCDAMQVKLIQLGETVPMKWTKTASFPKITRKKA